MKPIPRHVRESNIRFLPRLIKRGLIEASERQSTPLTMGYLPRLIKRGLIEARVFIMTMIGSSVALPRLIKRGLIEARPVWDCPDRPIPRLPRLIKRGLIEASWGHGRLLFFVAFRV